MYTKDNEHQYSFKNDWFMVPEVARRWSTGLRAIWRSRLFDTRVSMIWSKRLDCPRKNSACIAGGGRAAARVLKFVPASPSPAVLHKTQ